MNTTSDGNRVSTAPNVLVLGVNGFIGCHLSVAVLNAGGNLVGVDLPGTGVLGSRARKSMGLDGFETFELQSGDDSSLKRIISDFKPDILFHLAGSSNRENTPNSWKSNFESNVAITAGLIAVLLGLPETNRPITIVPGSQYEYGIAPSPWREEQVAQPTSAYGASKLACTDLLLAAFRDFLRGCVVRLPIVFGAAQRPCMLVPECIVKGIKGLDIDISGGRQMRRFLSASDAADFIFSVAISIRRGKQVPILMNSPANEPVAILDVVESIRRLFDNRLKVNVGVLKYRSCETLNAWPDASLSEKLNLIQLTPFEQALADIFNWYVRNDWFIRDYCDCTI